VCVCALLLFIHLDLLPQERDRSSSLEGFGDASDDTNDTPPHSPLSGTAATGPKEVSQMLLFEGGESLQGADSTLTGLGMDDIDVL
jgi:hypothetical protein